MASLRGKAAIHHTTENDVFLNFVDLYHVANLTEVHLHAIYHVAKQIHVEKAAVLNNPFDFLEKIETHRVSYTFAPHFFLSRLVAKFQSLGDVRRLKIEKVPQQEQNRRYGAYFEDDQHPLNLDHFRQNPSNYDFFDLSCLRAFISGGESNVTTTCDALESFFHDYEGPMNVIKPGFGMTETCAGAIYNVEDYPTYDVKRGSEFTSLGFCIRGIKMRVMRRDGMEAKEKEVGSLQLSGPVVFRGYYNNTE